MYYSAYSDDYYRDADDDEAVKEEVVAVKSWWELWTRRTMMKMKMMIMNNIVYNSLMRIYSRRQDKIITFCSTSSIKRLPTAVITKTLEHFFSFSLSSLLPFPRLPLSVNWIKMLFLIIHCSLDCDCLNKKEMNYFSYIFLHQLSSILIIPKPKQKIEVLKLVPFFIRKRQRWG